MNLFNSYVPDPQVVEIKPFSLPPAKSMDHRLNNALHFLAGAWVLAETRKQQLTNIHEGRDLA